MDLRAFELERYFAKYEFNTKHLLCSSDCESWSIDELLGLEPGAEHGLSKLWLGYIESRGGPELRREIAAIYSSIAPEQVLSFSGAEEAIFLFMHAALSPGDEIIVQEPCYQALAEVPRALGAKVVPWHSRCEMGWALDPSELDTLATGKTRAIVINQPHNPTGYLMPKAELLKLAEWAEERNIILFCDEVYRESEYSPADRLPAACDLAESAVSLGVLSKTYGLAGLRIGWVATRNSRLLEQMAGLKDYTTICNAAPSEFLAAIALRHRARLAERNREIISANLELLDRFFAKNVGRISWVRPKAGPVAFPWLLSGDSSELCHRLVTDAGVLLLPGQVFGPGFRAHFRMGFGRRTMPEALAGLEQFLSKSFKIK